MKTKPMRRKGTRPILPVAEVIASVADEPLRDRTMPQYTVIEDEYIVPAEPPLDIPPDWNLGALLNVRASGDHYAITLYPEESDWRHPERTLKFTNAGRCQDFLGQWYARVYHDPRAG